MTSTELIHLIEDWLNRMGGPLTLDIDGGPVLLTRYPRGIGCSARLMSAIEVDDALLHRALVFSSASLQLFGLQAAAPAYAKEDKQLWLLMRHAPDEPQALCRTLEMLVNQRDAWQGLLLAERRDIAIPVTNLHTLAWSQGDWHA
ncbi:type III secretion system chaperone [Lonsdalea populi]|uniref:type III secretion system chaperone n=1 Tax=Lonsdalea populi TaxID=1172565 RepID=UPI000A1F2746|nr:type III secretion system chaperone [Lonsdalea populi]OSN02627.1 serine kinase [Lonsdalea populi]QPQ25615.1 serine kinase [Lonsdalea populi]RAT44190.1 serine kinase [Lonsdalea populi]RAT48067.1 serine kinase [Lonsdalea populi]RAT53386.1 serine kinase [Lonsdalea populi]